MLEPLFRELKKGRQGANGENEYTSLPPYMLSQVKVPIPVTPKGVPDLNAQSGIAQKLSFIEQTRNILLKKKADIETISVTLDNDEYAIKYYTLDSLFDTIKGLSKYTKKYGNMNSGEYPVYSASSQTPLTYINSFDYNGRYMTWSTNGFAGTILILEGKFSINGDRGILIPKNGRCDLDFDYVKYTLEPIFRKLAKGRKGENGEDEFTKLYPSMLKNIMVPIPVDDSGNISLVAQKEISSKYAIVEQCKKEVAEKLELLLQQNINI